MVNEVVFEERDSQYQMWCEDKGEYTKYMDEKISNGKIDGRHPITGLAEAFSGAGLDTGHNSETAKTKSLKEL